jgi:hypothetical protein
LTHGVGGVATTYPIIVGAGGDGSTITGGYGDKGSDSVFSSITSLGGGGGAPANAGANRGGATQILFFNWWYWNYWTRI